MKCPICQQSLGYSYVNVQIEIGFAHVCAGCKKNTQVPFKNLVKWGVAKDRVHNPYLVAEEEQGNFLWLQEEGIYAPYFHEDI